MPSVVGVMLPVLKAYTVIPKYESTNHFNLMTKKEIQLPGLVLYESRLVVYFNSKPALLITRILI